jgi:hypothetical protein
MRLRLARRALCVSIAVFVTGCGDATAPEAAQYAGTYVLQTVAGDRLPAVLSSGETFVWRVLSETITLRPDGSASLTSSREWQWVGRAPETQSIVNDYRFRVVGDHIELFYICPNACFAIAIPPMIARRDGLGLRIDVAEGLRVPLRYSQLVESVGR